MEQLQELTGQIQSLQAETIKLREIVELEHSQFLSVIAANDAVKAELLQKNTQLESRISELEDALSQGIDLTPLIESLKLASIDLMEVTEKIQNIVPDDESTPVEPTPEPVPA